MDTAFFQAFLWSLVSKLMKSQEQDANRNSVHMHADVHLNVSHTKDALPETPFSEHNEQVIVRSFVESTTKVTLGQSN